MFSSGKYLASMSVVVARALLVLCGPGCSSSDSSEKSSRVTAALDGDGGPDVACTPAKCPTDLCNLQLDDGCGHVLTCNTCLKGQTCQNGYCTNECVKNTCQQDGTCGDFPDGCGGGIHCGCPSGQQCQSGQCVCQPNTNVCANG